ncbi:MFS transporter [Bradyrhizobium genosp. L]|uniref:MFS transporter n=1 Tax=Bradyrhizobium genosp. L TaxID=83637 RepID=UPI0018A2FDE0|nr:MFS transporter [Bradyrhizobium genosp. L]QPF87655.1 MFS transporter [Bradyrhizobium genosp. L]
MSEEAASGTTDAPPARGAAVIFIFVTILLDTLALGVVIPILPKLIESFVDNDTASAARIFGLFGQIDPRLPFWVAAGLSFANGLYGLLILPESLPVARRAPFRWRSANPVGALHLLRSNRVLAGLSLANFFAQLAHVVLPSVFVLYATYRYGWDAGTVGATLALVGLCAMIVQGAAIGPIVKHFGERNTLFLGLAFGAAGFFIFGAAPTGHLFWIGIPVMALWGIAGAATQALTTQLVAADQQGQLQGATTSVQSVSQLIGPFLFTLTFAYFIGGNAPLKMPGAPFYLAAVLLLLALLIAWRAMAQKA